MKRFLGSILFLLLLVGSFFFQTPISFAASTHTKLQASPLDLGGGTLNRAIWVGPQTLGFSVSGISTGVGGIQVYVHGTTPVQFTQFLADSNGNAVGELPVDVCDNLSVTIFDGQAGAFFPTPIPSCSTFTPAPYGPDTCLSGYVWREAYSSEDHACVDPTTRSQAAYDNSQASSRVDPSGPYGPDTCISGYVWREASKGAPTGLIDHVCVDPATRSQAAYDNSQAPYRKLFP